ncbi:MAG: Holliday junction branch migration protein RuvA [Caldilineaceae bacterium]|nr:Holliday junction branch migration protein RuvA [Caldilineaceae bacterium]
MIRTLNGIVTGRGTDHLVVEIGGALGLKVLTTEAAIAQHGAGRPVALHTYLQVREDALTLFGFLDDQELELFELLLGVSGVGPKVALSVLNTLTPDAIRLALANDEPGVIARAPGIGKRTAQKIVLELKDKVRLGDGDDLAGLAAASAADTEVLEALVALGYSVVEAQRAIQQLPGDVTTVEERLRLALAQFTN